MKQSRPGYLHRVSVTAGKSAESLFIRIENSIRQKPRLHQCTPAKSGLYQVFVQGNTGHLLLVRQNGVEIGYCERNAPQCMKIVPFKANDVLQIICAEGLPDSFRLTIVLLLDEN